MITETEIDFEEELKDDEHSHAIPFCFEHKSPEWFPIAGTIAQALCGRLIRVRNFLSNDPSKLDRPACEDCLKFKGKTACYVCGRKLYGYGA